MLSLSSRTVNYLSLAALRRQLLIDFFGSVRYMSDGSLDTTFGNGGKVLTPIGDGNAEANAIALQTDGKIVVAGYTSTNSDFATVRYNENGTLDAMFDGDGIVTTTVTETSGDSAYDVLIQKNGKNRDRRHDGFPRIRF